MTLKGPASYPLIAEGTVFVAWGPIPLAGATGHQRWVTQTEYYGGEPVARDGVIYVHDAHYVFAVCEAEGSTVWTSPYVDGNSSSVAVDGSGVFVSSGCSRTGLSLRSGAILRHNDDGCEGAAAVLPTSVEVGSSPRSATLPGTITSSPVIAGHTIYVAAGTGRHGPAVRRGVGHRRRRRTARRPDRCDHHGLRLSTGQPSGSVG